MATQVTISSKFSSPEGEGFQSSPMEEVELQFVADLSQFEGSEICMSDCLEKKLDFRPLRNQPFR
jgi:hypothetical protein